MLEAVLCDMDGTLVDSNALHAEAWSRTFAHFGIVVGFDEALHQIGKGGDQIIPTFVSRESLPRLEKPIKEYRSSLFHREYFNRIKAFPGSRELLLKMRAVGLRIAVASSSEKDDLEKLKEIAGIADLVEKETSSDDANQSKPEPDIFQAALDRLGVQPAEAIALGDTPWDIEAASKAGVPTIAVTSGGWTEEELLQAGAIEVYKDVHEISEMFTKSRLNRREVAA
ncbi:putative phosphatase [Acidisarcina polymorpha]|uniref:Putative phosphatase n=1 Tax=Acidisarcina polymorpha TaxID=2211140 RepID=A0A2Z5FUJ8_9BACT|nr:HAD family phosphatase [Acidisarcina polymorpha]AXC10412.1 putative phosphatase [Acidisarcina polymorpha]